MPAAVDGSASRIAGIFSSSGRNGVTTVRMIDGSCAHPAELRFLRARCSRRWGGAGKMAHNSEYSVSGYARPELLATPEWLAENIGRPGFGVLDLRWRPDGSGRRLYASGHIPGAMYVDWQTDLVEHDEDSEVLLLAGPQHLTETLTRAGIGNGMVAVAMDDTAASYSARTWWTD